LATNAAISDAVDGFTSGSGASPSSDVVRHAAGSAGYFGGSGSRDIETRKEIKHTMWRKLRMIQYTPVERSLTFAHPADGSGRARQIQNFIISLYLSVVLQF
jgi:hypothetical protein